MTSSRTHGPWQGIDFDPTTDLARTAALCPEGWLEVFWDTNEKPHRLRPVRAFAVDLSAPDDYENALNQGPIDFGHEEWPHGRVFIARLSYERDGEGFMVVTDLLLGAADEPAHADLLPCSECPKCHRSMPLFPCGQCKAEMCADCGDEHTPPDCPPEFERYQQALAEAMIRPEEQVAGAGVEGQRLRRLRGELAAARDATLRARLPILGVRLELTAEPGEVRRRLAALGPDLRTLREEHGVTLGQLARALGIPASTLSGFELAGEGELPGDEQAKIRRIALGFRTLRENAGFGVRGVASALGIPHTIIGQIERAGRSVSNPAALHPCGECTCTAEGTCDWCRMNEAREAAEAEQAFAPAPTDERCATCSSLADGPHDRDCPTITEPDFDK